jgi:hypothetical protein
LSRSWYYGLVYLSVAGLLLALHRADYLVLPEVRSPLALLASLGALALGLLGTCLVWHRTLARVGQPVAFTRSLAATGLTVFGKYLPGKVWVLVGRAAYVARPGSGGFLAVAAASVGTQLGSLWLGLAIGIAAIALLDAPASWLSGVAGAWAVLTLIAFSPPAHAIAIAIARRALGRTVDLPLLSLRDVAALSPWYALTWVSWSVGFYLLAEGLLGSGLPLSLGLAFPLASAAGMLAVFLPGGLGAREGVLATCLGLAGATIVEATSVAVAARLWSVVGEVGIFAAGLAAHRSAGAPRD